MDDESGAVVPGIHRSTCWEAGTAIVTPRERCEPTALSKRASSREFPGPTSHSASLNDAVTPAFNNSHAADWTSHAYCLTTRR